MKTLKNVLIRGQIKTMITFEKGRQKLMAKRGDMYISDAVRILIAVVLGALILAALVLIFKNTVIPKTNKNINTMFDTASSTIYSSN